jgi:hypothetical protein
MMGIIGGDGSLGTKGKRDLITRKTLILVGRKDSTDKKGPVHNKKNERLLVCDTVSAPAYTATYVTNLNVHPPAPREAASETGDTRDPDQKIGFLLFTPASEADPREKSTQSLYIPG